MASFTIVTASTVAQILNDGEAGVIAHTGSLSTLGNSITSTGSVSISVLGSLFGQSSAIEHNGENFTLNIGQTASVAGGSSDTVDVDFVGLVFISNDGSVLSDSDALDIRGTGSIGILNNGSISGRSDGIVTSGTGGLTQIVNLGTIWGNDGGIDHLSGNSQLINYGTIFGNFYGFDGASNVDQVSNYGLIHGDVNLGAGNDVFKGQNGTVVGVVNGGSGNDTITCGAGDDILVGGAGRDILRGGGGNDFFDFNSTDDSVRGTNRDQIRDFKRGDKIDLAGIDANINADGNQKFKFIGDNVFSKKAGELRFKNDILQGDVNGDGKADFEILVNVNNLVKGDFVL